jgi:hypothetical protein
VIGVVLGLLDFNPSLVRGVVGLFIGYTPRKPSATVLLVQPLPPSAAELAASAAAKFEAQQAADFSGKWYCRTVLQDRGNCQLTLEIRPQLVPVGQFAGYGNMVCMDMRWAATQKINAFVFNKMMGVKLTPAARVLSVKVTSGAID